MNDNFIKRVRPSIETRKEISVVGRVVENIKYLPFCQRIIIGNVIKIINMYISKCIKIIKMLKVFVLRGKIAVLSTNNDRKCYKGEGNFLFLEERLPFCQ